MNKDEIVSMDETEAMIEKPIATRNSTFNCCFSFFCCSSEENSAEVHAEGDIQIACPVKASATAPLPGPVAIHQEILHDYRPLRTIYVFEKYGHRFGGF